MLHERFLQRVEHVAPGESFDRQHFLPVNRFDRQVTGTFRLVIHEHGTRAALTDSAAVFRAGDPQFHAQDPEQAAVGGDLELYRPAV